MIFDFDGLRGNERLENVASPGLERHLEAFRLGVFAGAADKADPVVLGRVDAELGHRASEHFVAGGTPISAQVLSKPYRKQELGRKLRQALGHG